MLWAAEKDQAACDTYNHNAEVAVSRRLDLRTFDFDELRRELPGPVDCLFGGPPCQGMSKAGEMRLDDPRNELVNVFMDAVDKLRPRSFLMENVKNLGTNALFKPILDKLIERASSLGYATNYCPPAPPSRTSTRTPSSRKLWYPASSLPR